MKQYIVEGIKDAPIVGLAGFKILGVSLPDWGLILGLIYGVARIWMLGVEAYWKWKDRRDAGK
jgi:hypothetical protein